MRWVLFNPALLGSPWRPTAARPRTPLRNERAGVAASSWRSMPTRGVRVRRRRPGLRVPADSGVRAAGVHAGRRGSAQDVEDDREEDRQDDRDQDHHQASRRAANGADWCGAHTPTQARSHTPLAHPKGSQHSSGRRDRRGPSSVGGDVPETDRSSGKPGDLEAVRATRSSMTADRPRATAPAARFRAAPRAKAANGVPHAIASAAARAAATGFASRMACLQARASKNAGPRQPRSGRQRTCPQGQEDAVDHLVGRSVSLRSHRQLRPPGNDSVLRRASKPRPRRSRLRRGDSRVPPRPRRPGTGPQTGRPHDSPRGSSRGCRTPPAAGQRSPTAASDGPREVVGEADQERMTNWERHGRPPRTGSV